MRIITGLAFALLFAVTASASFASKKFEVEGGSLEQTVKAGDTIQTIVFKMENMISTSQLLMSGISCDCSRNGRKSTCTVSGRVPANTSGSTYNMTMDVKGTIDNKDSVVNMKITVIPMGSPIEVISGSKDQTVTAGEPIDTIVFGF